MRTSLEKLSPKIERRDEFDILIFRREQISLEVQFFIRALCGASFAEKRKNYSYAENYEWNETDNKTLAYKLKQNQFDTIYFVYKADTFLSFSGLYLNHERVAFGGVRRFSSISSPIRPYHLAYVIPLQFERALELGARAFVLSYNKGIRDKFYLRIKKIGHQPSVCPTSKIANSFFQENNFLFQDEPVICNSTLQRLHYALIDPSMTSERLLSNL